MSYVKDRALFVWAVRNMLDNGETAPQIAEGLETTEPALRMRLYRAGAQELIDRLWRRKYWRGVELYAEWDHYRRLGYDQPEVAERLGVTRAALERSLLRTRKRCRDRGLPFPTRVVVEPTAADAVDMVRVRRGGVVRWVRREEAA